MDMQRTSWKDIRSQAIKDLATHIGAIGAIFCLIYAVGFIESQPSDKESLDREMLAFAASDGPRAGDPHGNLIIEFEDIYPASAPEKAADTPPVAKIAALPASGGESVSQARNTPPMPPRRPVLAVAAAATQKSDTPRAMPHVMPNPVARPVARPVTLAAAPLPQPASKRQTISAPMELCGAPCSQTMATAEGQASQAASVVASSERTGPVLGAGRAILGWVADASDTVYSTGKAVIGNAVDAIVPDTSRLERLL